MAINVALPLSGLSDMFEGCCLLSPISPIDMTFRENFKMMVSPDSESSSGVSSFDSADVIKYQSLQNHRASSPSTTGSTTSSASSSSSTTPSEPNTLDGVTLTGTAAQPSVGAEHQFAARLIIQRRLEEAILRHENRPIMYKGRNVLDLAANLENSCQLQYAELPDNNLKMFLENRSQYHRLSAAGHNQEFNTSICRGCDFTFPHVDLGPVGSGSGASANCNSSIVAQSMLSTMVMTPPPPKHSPVPPAISALQQQQQQQDLFNRIYKMNLAKNHNRSSMMGNHNNNNNNNMHNNYGGNSGSMNNSNNNSSNNIFNNIGTFNASNHNNSNNNNSNNLPSNNNTAAFMKFMRASSNNNMNNPHIVGTNNNSNNINNYMMNSNHQINPNGGNNTPFKMYKMTELPSRE